ncbi:hypothetical protein AHIS2_p044 [Acaryochloris phage A-HIS2]|nr:hypothetical protein AHIS2_p044 [Acaryochloris phage A-HIS2]
MRFLFTAKIHDDEGIEVTDLVVLDLRSIPTIYHGRLRCLRVGAEVCYATVIFLGQPGEGMIETTRYTSFKRLE